MPQKSEQSELQPGADRFWGQFSQSRAGRTNTDAEPDEDRNSQPGSEANAGGGHGDCLEWCPICRSAELFRHTVSPELRQQAESIQHEAMGVLKAFLDAYADKAGNPGGQTGGRETPAREEPEEPPAPRVTDIPLD